MKNFIIFDLEWNQSFEGKETSIEHFPFEIIEIGAIKTDENFQIVSQFHKLISPQVYTRLHYKISEVTHMSIEQLEQEGQPFQDVIKEFIHWCGNEYLFCTWGSMDLTELQRNMDFYQIPIPFQKPLMYYDVQKLYALFYKDGVKPSLDVAVEELGLLEERPFHRALDDAYYTGKVFKKMMEEIGPDHLLVYQSIDYYRIPKNKDEEIQMVFPDYSKYVSRIFPSKEDAMKERLVTEMKCYKCGRMLRKKIRWFTPNQKIYYGLAICPEHGYLKGKVRIKRVDDTKVYAVKTLKLTDEEGAIQIASRKEEVKKKRALRSREKKNKQKK